MTANPFPLNLWTEMDSFSSRHFELSLKVEQTITRDLITMGIYMHVQKTKKETEETLLIEPKK